MSGSLPVANYCVHFVKSSDNDVNIQWKTNKLPNIAAQEGKLL